MLNVKSLLLLLFLFSFHTTTGYSKNIWKKIEGNASDVATDEKGRLFVVSSSKRQVFNWNIFKQKWDWLSKAPGDVTKIAATKNGKLYGIVKGKVYQYAAKKWKPLGDFKASDIGAGANGSVWAISRNKKIAKWDSRRKRWLVLKTKGTIADGKKPLALDVDKGGNPFITFYGNSVAYYDASKKRWKGLPGKLVDLACSSSGYVYAVNSSGAIEWWNTKKQRWEVQSKFPKLNSPFKRISVLPNNTPWVLTQKGDIYHRVNAAYTSFLPSKHGYRFRNSFPFEAKVSFKPGVLDQVLPEKYWSYEVNESYGLCGGMALGAHRHYLQKQPIPSQTSTPKKNGPLYKELWDGLFDSFGKPKMGYLIKSMKWWGSFESRDNLLHHDTKQELNTITKKLDKKELVQLILMFETKMTGSPWDNHQVLAYGYEKDYVSIRIFVYDPNFPGRDDIVITYTRKPNGDYYLYRNGHSTKPKEIFGMFPIFPKLKK